MLAYKPVIAGHELYAAPQAFILTNLSPHFMDGELRQGNVTMHVNCCEKIIIKKITSHVHQVFEHGPHKAKLLPRIPY